MNLLHQTKRTLRNNALTWRYVLNLRPALSHLVFGAEVSGESERVLAALNRDGIAVTTSDALLGASDTFQELRLAIEKLQKAQGQTIQEARARAGDASAIG